MNDKEEAVKKSLVEFFDKNDPIMNISLGIFVRFWFSKLDKKLSILDCGCGMGCLIKKLKEFGFTNVIGLELSAEMAKKAEAFTFSKIINSDVTGLASCFVPGSLDLIIFSDILHHLESSEAWEKVLSGAAGALKEGGLVIIREPHPTPLMRLLFAISANKIFYLPFLKDRLKGYVIEKEMHEHFFSLWPSLHRELLSRSGLRIISEFTGPVRKIIKAVKEPKRISK